MISNLDAAFSANIKKMKRSEIRELLKLTADKSIISFAGGLPSPDSFPVEELKIHMQEMMEEEPFDALQYGSTEGDNLLRQLLIERYKKEGLSLTLDNLIITTASQQGLDLSAKIFINPGDKIICGKPTYLGGLSAFVSYQAEMIGIELDENGMRADLLEKTLEAMHQKGEKPKFIYVIPDFQNPAGITMSEERRKQILALAKKYDVLILEDSPYRELRFEGETQKMIYSLDNSGQVIVLGTFSKIFAPGFRIGWVIAHPSIIDKYITAKQATDLCTPPFNQKIAARYLKSGIIDSKIQDIVVMYRAKRDLMIKTLEENMPKGVTWTHPQGGLFLFLTLPQHIDGKEMFPKAIAEKVAYVVGSAFYPDGSGKNTMRLNFSYGTHAQIVEGIKRLATVIKSYM